MPAKTGVLQQDAFSYDYAHVGPILIGQTKPSVTHSFKTMSHVTGEFIRNHRYSTGPSGFPYVWAYLNWNPNRNFSLWFYGQDKIDALLALKAEGLLLGHDFMCVGVTSSFRPRTRQDEATMVAKLQAAQQANPNVRQQNQQQAGFSTRQDHNSMIVSNMFRAVWNPETGLYKLTDVVFQDPCLVLTSEEDALNEAYGVATPATRGPSEPEGDALDHGPTPYKGVAPAAETADEQGSDPIPL